MTSDVLILFLFLLSIAAIVFLVAFVLTGHSHTSAVKKRDKMLRSSFGEDIKIYRYFPIPQDVEEVVQGGLHKFIQEFRELITGDEWLFIQPTFIVVPKFTSFEERSAATLSLFSRKIDQYSPTFVIRNRKNKSLTSRYYQTQVKNKRLVQSELDFDGLHSLYAEQGKHIQALQIMSPELLEALMNAPFRADIVIKKNQLYYILPGEKPAERVLGELFIHSTSVMKELGENLDRWAKSAANQDELERIKKSNLAVTLREAHSVPVKVGQGW